MATPFSTIRTRVRTFLRETTANYWTDAEIFDHLLAGAKDLWGSLVDLHEEHYQTVDATNVSLAASTDTLTGVPADVLRVLLIEPRTITTAGASRYVTFRPKKYNSDEFSSARMMSAQDPSGALTIFYAISGAGAPVAAPVIYAAPHVTTAIPLRLVYIPSLSSSLAAGSDNPIPGESDNALFAWGVAWCRAKEREDQSPDPNWLATYATEKQAIQTRLTPRQEQEEETVQGMFDGFDGA